MKGKDMKKKFLVLLLIVALLPIKTFAKTYYDNYNTKNFKETLEAEGMEIKNKNYKEDDKQAIIYMFRGDGCGFCRSFLEFLNSISEEYGKYFKMVSFEVWHDANNSELLNKMPIVTNKSAGGVPYIIIGEKVFGGYSEDYNEDIKNAIMAQYNDSSYDVFEKLDEKLNGNSGTSSFAVIFWNAFFIVAAAVAVIVVSNKNTKAILDKLPEQKKKQRKKQKKKNKKLRLSFFDKKYLL